MARAENEALVRRIFDAFARKAGLCRSGTCSRDDATWTVPGTSAMAGTFRGRGEIFAFLGRLPKETDGTYSSTLIDVLASDDRAAALYRASGERRGAQLELDQVLLFRIEDGLIQAVARPAERPRRVRYVLGPMSDLRFADGLRYRFEIPSVEGPGVMRAVLDGGRGARGSRATGVAGIGRDDADGRRARRDGAAGKRPRGRGVAVPRPARSLGHRGPVVRHLSRRRHSARRRRDRAVPGRGTPGACPRHSVVPRGRPRCAGDARTPAIGG